MMTMKTCRCSLLLVAVVVATAVVCTFAAPSPAPAADTDPYGSGPYPCPWRTVLHPEDPFIQNLGQWAVLQKHVVMHFLKVSSAKLQGVGSCTKLTRDYYFELIVHASLRGGQGGDDDYKYRVVVYVTNFTQPQKVESFVYLVPGLYPPAAAPAEFSITGQ